MILPTQLPSFCSIDWRTKIFAPKGGNASKLRTWTRIERTPCWRILLSSSMVKTEVVWRLGTWMTPGRRLMATP